MEIQATTVINWIDANLPPLSWSVIKVCNMDVLMSNMVKPSAIDDSTKFNKEIISALHSFIKKKYDQELPFHQNGLT